MPRSTPRWLTIGEVSQRTGVPTATLRSWEARYGFPEPERLPGGHRRYDEVVVDTVQEVLRQKQTGFGLEAAIRLATSASAIPRQPRSVYAEIRRQHPELAPVQLTKASLIALSHAIEDECAARAERPFLFGAFQREEFLRRSSARWAELARTAASTVVFTELDEPRPLRSGPMVEVALPGNAPLRREWVVICDAQVLPACLAAVERPGQADLPDGRRLFESVWSVDPGVVRLAGRVAAAIADEHRPGWRDSGVLMPSGEPAAASADLRRASDLLTRTMGYLDASR